MSISLKPGFIFIPVCDRTAHDCPLNYLANYLGGLGYFAKINPMFENGYEPVCYFDYLKA